MTTTIIDDDDNKGYTVTQYWNGELMYQITQRYNPSRDESDIYWNSHVGYVSLSKSDIEYIYKKIVESEK